eukprot:SAG11_NODE_223_length_12120_cov_6.351884_7_plen_505_part_00
MFNLDTSKASGAEPACMLPGTRVDGFFYMSTLVILFIAMASSCTVHSIQSSFMGGASVTTLLRAVVAVAMYAYTPITNMALEMLFCREFTDELGTSRQLLVTDPQVECYTGAHALTFWISLILLVVFLAVPIVFARMAIRQRAIKDFSLSVIKFEDGFEDLWVKADADKSGQLNAEEALQICRGLIKKSLFALHHLDPRLTLEDMSPSNIEHYCKQITDRCGVTVATFDKDGDGEVSKKEFKQWYNKQVGTVQFTYLDAMVGSMNHTTTYQLCWFAEVILMKTLINLVYVASFNGVNLDILLEMGFIYHIFMLSTVLPYADHADQRIEMIAMCALVWLVVAKTTFTLEFEAGKDRSSWIGFALIFSSLGFMLVSIFTVLSRICIPKHKLYAAHQQVGTKGKEEKSWLLRCPGPWSKAAHSAPVQPVRSVPAPMPPYKPKAPPKKKKKKKDSSVEEEPAKPKETPSQRFRNAGRLLGWEKKMTGDGKGVCLACSLSRLSLLTVVL